MAHHIKTPAIMTDLYELTMAQAYYINKMREPATFSLFIRKYPENRGYLISAGLQQALEFLENMQFSQDDLDYLKGTGMFHDDFLHYLGGVRFRGRVHAIPEGRLFFKDEPILEVTAPIIEAQLAETTIINAINLQVTLATKVSRCVHAAGGRSIVDFGLRRTQGGDAGMKLVRAGYIAGLSATSNVLAGKSYGIPVSGTMAHSYVTSFDHEIDSFRLFADIYGDQTILLIDTFDTIKGAEKAIAVAAEMADRGKKLRGVRLDSGDMAQLSRQVRAMLDKAGFKEMAIFASGGFDEYKIDRCLAEGAQINGFGVGTKMAVSADAPYTDIAYKLVQYDGRPVLKLSSGKKTLVGEKQVFRSREKDRLLYDVIALREEEHAGAEALLQKVMADGRRLHPAEPLNVLRDRLKAEMAGLGDVFKRIREPETFPVRVSERLEALQGQVIHKVMEKELGES